MFDFAVIVEYLDTLSPVGKLIPTSRVVNGPRSRPGKRWPMACSTPHPGPAGATGPAAPTPSVPRPGSTDRWPRPTPACGHEPRAGRQAPLLGIHLSLSGHRGGLRAGLPGPGLPQIDWRAGHGNLPAQSCTTKLA